jgi:NADH dehydrogenase FAD-containing subunit
MSEAHGINVIIAGSGPAGIEAALVLRKLAGDLVETTVLTPDEEFVHLPMTVLTPFARSGTERHPMSQLAAAAGAVLRRGAVASSIRR